METVDSGAAQTQLPRLLERVERGEIITITRHGKPVARLVPVAPTARRPGIDEAIEAMRAFQDQEAPILSNDLAIRDLIDEGGGSNQGYCH
jgi:prevent-host-death family protein